jgi:enamine deaminase RidA (YjgF/YER057c/UK114 family)
MGLGFGDVVKMLVFLVADPADKDGHMDFAGFMQAYTQYFGTPEQPNLPARSAVQVAGLAAPGMLVEIEVILAKPAKKKKYRQSKGRQLGSCRPTLEKLRGPV